MSFSESISALVTVRRVIAVISIAAIGGTGYKFGPTVWHKYHTDPAKAASAGISSGGTNSVGAKLAANDLGEVTLTNHYETCFNLGHGKNCLVVPRVIDSHNVELTLSLESLTAEGTVHDLSVTQITAKTGKSTEIAIGDVEFSLTPKMMSE